MKRIVLLAALLLAACAPKTEPYSVRMVRSEIKRAPEATFLDGQEGGYKWNYTTGLELRSFLDVARAYDIPEFDAYVHAWYDGILDENGAIGGKYKLENYNLDHICPARTLVSLYQVTPDVRYAKAILTARQQLDGQPRTEAGAFWHKQSYPYQVWLDGMYMAQPFYMEYEKRFNKMQGCLDSFRQFKNVEELMKDPKTGLYFHGYDESRKMYWADKETGLSPNFWLRALGWFTVALVDTAEAMDESMYYEYRYLQTMLENLANALIPFQDESGMFYQIVDKKDDERNYDHQSTGSQYTV